VLLFNILSILYWTGLLSVFCESSPVRCTVPQAHHFRLSVLHCSWTDIDGLELSAWGVRDAAFDTDMSRQLL